MSYLERAHYPVLIGDIGGTNARFAVIATPEAAVKRFPTVKAAEYPTIADAVRSVLGDTTSEQPHTAILALAGPISGDRIELTNSAWVVEPPKLIDELRLSEVILLNDFEAQSLSLPGLTSSDVDAIGGGLGTDHGPRLVVGPGTGLGAGALIHARDTWIPVPGEGGHIDLGPVTERDFAHWPYLERLHGRISAEALISGGGLVRLYRALARRNEVEPRFADPVAVTAAGLSGEDTLAAETLDLFAIYLGRFAGDLALVFGARGGVYLAGGVSAAVAPVLKGGGFREAFVAKEPHRDYLDQIPTSIITKPDAALAGIADYARVPERFGVWLGRRWWRRGD